MKEYNVSLDENYYSQRNNEIDSKNVCGPTNFIQGLKASGWEWDNSMLKQFRQPEDKLTYFVRTNKDVLKYYEKHYHNMYLNWWNESHKLAEERNAQYWNVACVYSYPPNEVHDVMSYAVNLFVGYSAKDIETMKRRPVTRFYNEFDENEVVWQICKKGAPVISSVDPFKNGGGHYITIVGLQVEDDFVAPTDYSQVQKKICQTDKIKSYIIDNTYGRFNFANKRYENVSGNNEKIDRDTFLSIIKPVSHYFSAGAAACC